MAKQITQAPTLEIDDADILNGALPRIVARQAQERGPVLRLALAATHRLPSVFANPDAFDPDRFAPPRDEERATPYGLVTFGGGARLCIGINFANIEVKALAAHVLRTFSLEAVEEKPPVQVGLTATVLPGGAPLRVRAKA